MKAYLVSVPTTQEALDLAAALLDEGVRPEELSVVLDEGYSERISDSGPVSPPPSLGEDLVAERRHHTDFNYSATHNPEMEPAMEAHLEALRPLYESEVGGGISTASARDAVSAVEEMDDSNEIAEELMHPLGARDVRTHGPHSLSEIDPEDIAGQFDDATERTAIHGYESGLGVGVLAALIPAVVPGVGVVLGDGDLASDLLGEEEEAIENGMRPFLKRRGLSESEAIRFESTVLNGGGVLEVGAASGEASARQVRKILDPLSPADVIAVEIS